MNDIIMYGHVDETSLCTKAQAVDFFFLFPFYGRARCKSLDTVASIALMAKAEEGERTNDWAIGMEQKL